MMQAWEFVEADEGKLIYYGASHSVVRRVECKELPCGCLNDGGNVVCWVHRDDDRPLTTAAA
jgi:hypothetical protein